MATNDFLRVVKILPFDNGGPVFLACYEGKDPIEITPEEAEVLAMQR
jgi:hypothetical protein